MRPISSGLLALLLTFATAMGQPPTGPNTAAAAVLRRAQAFIASSACPSAEARAAVPAEPMTLMGHEVTYHRILIEGCGHRIQRNYVASFYQPDGSWLSIDMLHGTSALLVLTGTDWSLDLALGAAVRAVRTVAPNCRDIMPQSLDVDGSDSEPTAPRRTRPWTETWVFEACGPRFAVEMRFSPNGSGSIDFGVSLVRRLN